MEIEALATQTRQRDGARSGKVAETAERTARIKWILLPQLAPRPQATANQAVLPKGSARPGVRYENRAATPTRKLQAQQKVLHR